MMSSEKLLVLCHVQGRMWEPYCLHGHWSVQKSLDRAKLPEGRAICVSDHVATPSRKAAVEYSLPPLARVRVYNVQEGESPVKAVKKNHVDNLSPGLQMLPNTESLMTASEHAYPASTKALEKRLKKGLQTFLSLYIYSAFSQGKKEHTFSTSWSTLLILVKERDPDRATKMYKYYPRFRDMNADILVWAP